MNISVRTYLTSVFAIPAFIICISFGSWAQDPATRLSPEQTQTSTNHANKLYSKQIRPSGSPQRSVQPRMNTNKH